MSTANHTTVAHLVMQARAASWNGCTPLCITPQMSTSHASVATASDEMEDTNGMAAGTAAFSFGLITRW